MGDTHIINWYTPNGGNPDRLSFKYRFYDAIEHRIAKLLSENKHVVMGGDLNVAHTPLDIFDATLTNHSGFLNDERAWMDRLVALGMSDTFRLFEKEKGHYSWWNLKDPTRGRNQGIRFDYFLTSPELTKKVTSAVIRHDVFGSDHCPVVLELSTV